MENFNFVQCFLVQERCFSSIILKKFYLLHPQNASSEKVSKLIFAVSEKVSARTQLNNIRFITINLHVPFNSFIET